MAEPYSGREQTQAKHYILKRYLQALAYKVLTFNDITYVDGFSGPWRTATEDFSDSSFMIAISTLLDVQEQIRARAAPGRTNPRIRCFFSESDPETFKKLERAVSRYHRPTDGFEVKTYFGRFEDAVDEIDAYIAGSFPLIFIDPTGWTGYPFETIKKLFVRQRCEVLINFMFDFVSRFSHRDDENIDLSLNEILGGPGWRKRLDPELSQGLAVEKLFRETLKASGRFRSVVSAKIERATMDRTHFSIMYATKQLAGLKVFRDTEYKALQFHSRNRATAQERRREERTGISDMFADDHATVKEISIDEFVEKQAETASATLLEFLERHGEVRFERILAEMLEEYMLRETNVKDICVKLAKAGKIENTWGKGNRKPRDASIIRLIALASTGH